MSHPRGGGTPSVEDELGALQHHTKDPLGGGAEAFLKEHGDPLCLMPSHLFKGGRVFRKGKSREYPASAPREKLGDSQMVEPKQGQESQIGEGTRERLRKGGGGLGGSRGIYARS
jgi:hypothetical protein